LSKERLVALAIQLFRSIRDHMSAATLIALLIGLGWTIAPEKTLAEMFSMTGAKGVIPDRAASTAAIRARPLPAKQCAACHPQHFAEWSRSFHARSLRSEDFIKTFAQYLASLATPAREDPQASMACFDCHAPLLKNAEPNMRAKVTAFVLARDTEKLDGFEVGCVSCHLERGRLFSGSIAKPQVNPFHLSKFSTSYKDAGFCSTCHTWKTVPCSDVYTDWKKSRAAKQGRTCQACHMAERAGVAAAGAPQRTIHSHVFPGSRSAAMLQQAVRLGLKAAFREDHLEVVVTVRNLTPHRVPDG
jgi:Cytochrome c554 and c-prime